MREQVTCPRCQVRLVLPADSGEQRMRCPRCFGEVDLFFNSREVKDVISEVNGLPGGESAISASLPATKATSRRQVNDPAAIVCGESQFTSCGFAFLLTTALIGAVVAGISALGNPSSSSIMPFVLLLLLGTVITCMTLLRLRPDMFVSGRVGYSCWASVSRVVFC
jgi:hypothetical protein